eukprot:185855_1
MTIVIHNHIHAFEYVQIGFLTTQPMDTIQPNGHIPHQKQMTHKEAAHSATIIVYSARDEEEEEDQDVADNADVIHDANPSTVNDGGNTSMIYSKGICEYLLYLIRSFVFEAI